MDSGPNSESVPENVNVAFGLFVGEKGFVPIVVSGGLRSITQVNEAGALWLPAASTALTEKVCEPFVNDDRVFGDVHAA